MIPHMIGFVNWLLRYKAMLRTFQMPLVVSCDACLTPCLLVPTHNLCKHIGPRSGLTNVGPDLDPISSTLRRYS